MNQRLKLSCSALALGLMLGFQASPVVAVKDGAEEAIRRINARKNAPQLSEEVEALRAGNMQLQQQLADFEQQHAQLADVARRVHVSLVDEPQNPIEDVERVREMLAPIEQPGTIEDAIGKLHFQLYEKLTGPRFARDAAEIEPLTLKERVEFLIAAYERAEAERGNPQPVAIAAVPAENAELNQLQAEIAQARQARLISQRLQQEEQARLQEIQQEIQALEQERAAKQQTLEQVNAGIQAAEAQRTQLEEETAARRQVLERDLQLAQQAVNRKQGEEEAVEQRLLALQAQQVELNAQIQALEGQANVPAAAQPQAPVVNAPVADENQPEGQGDHEGFQDLGQLGEQQ